MINQINGHPLNIRITPIAIANPTEKATVKRRPKTKLATGAFGIYDSTGPSRKITGLRSYHCQSRLGNRGRKAQGESEEDYPFPSGISFQSKFVGHFFAYREESTFQS